MLNIKNIASLVCAAVLHQMFAFRYVGLFSFVLPDFFKGKTVFNHWLPGICYSNITFQLVSEATFNKSTLVEYSGVRHEPKQHRTGEENVYIYHSQHDYMQHSAGLFP